MNVFGFDRFYRLTSVLRCGTDEEYNILVMERLGASLEELGLGYTVQQKGRLSGFGVVGCALTRQELRAHGLHCVRVC